MSRWGKRKASSTDAKEEDSGVDNGVTACELSQTRKVVVKEWKGQILVDIREYYTSKDGQLMPSKKGISLTLEQWELLREHADGVDRALDEV